MNQGSLLAKLFRKFCLCSVIARNNYATAYEVTRNGTHTNAAYAHEIYGLYLF
jgi:hypothetical protein